MADIEPGKVLSQGEVDALLSAITTGEIMVGVEESEASQVTAYDFRRPERVARDQLRAISTMHDVFARNVQAMLSGTLRTLVDVRVQGVDQLTFSEFVNSLPVPTVFSVVSAEPFEGNFVLEVNPVIAFPILERILGSSRASASHPERPLTEIEWGLMGTIIQRILEILSDAWAKVARVTFRMTAHESNPHLVPIMSPNEPVISVVLEVAIGETHGFLNLCVPVVAIEGVLEQISAHTWFVSARKAGAPTSEREQVVTQVSAAEVEVSTVLAQTTLTLDQVRELKPGSVVRTDHSPRSPVILCVEGRPKYLGVPVSVKDKLGLAVLRAVNAEEARRILRRGV